MRARAWKRLRRSLSATAGGVLTLLLVAFAVVGPLVARHGPLESDFVHGVTNQQMPIGPCAAFPFGADRLFRDVFARLAWGARFSLVVAAASTTIATVVGSVVGVVAGWFEGAGLVVPWPLCGGVVAAAAALALGRPAMACVTLAVAALLLALRRTAGPRIDVDGWLMRLVDVMLAFPFLLLILAIGAAFERTTAATVILTLGATGWLGIARMLRAKTLQVRSLDYVEASRALGQSTLSLIVRHVLPNIAGTLIVSATVQVAQMIVAESILGYLGVGISPPTPTWGRMLLEGQDDLTSAPWLVAAPAGAIVLAVLAFNMVGDGLRDALDPAAEV